MKYLLLAYTRLAEWDNVDVESPEFQAMCAAYDTLARELTASGELVTTEGLAHPAASRTVRHRDREVVAVDGPFAESKEVLASFAIVDCASHDRAVAIAGRIVAATGDSVEIRPIMDDAGAPE